MTTHFIGIGGIGMSALARLLLQAGQNVSGTDEKSSPLIEALEKEGVEITEAIDKADRVVYTSALSPHHPELQKARQARKRLLHRSELLQEIMKGKKELVITGTHGKTTTTALTSHLLLSAGLDPSFVIGGILQKWETNGRLGQGDYFVAEGDESDGSFLKTNPFAAIVTNLENDHLDYWKTAEALDSAFAKFCKQTKHLIWCQEDPRLVSLHLSGVGYRLERWTEKEAGVEFDVDGESYELPLFGRHNALNGVAVVHLGRLLGLCPATIRAAFLCFPGTKRRLEYKGSRQGVDVYDDYGHHPTEIQATIRAIRGKAKERRLVVLFQPHRYTRTRDLFTEFTTAFEEADLVCITDIYAAGETPIEGVSGEALAKNVRKSLYLKDLRDAPLQVHDVVLTIGAGSVTDVGPELLKKEIGKLKVALLFGGTSPEHEVSIASARNILSALAQELYQVETIGVTKKGVFFLGAPDQNRYDEPGGKVVFLEELKRFDVLIPVFHGPQGEDGMMQGLFETLNIPFVGCSYSSSAVCMHKGWTKVIAESCGVQTARYLQCDRATWKKDRSAVRGLPFPVFVKPVHLGSSIGMSRVENEDQLQAAAQKAFQVDDVILVEEAIKGREIEFGVLGNDWIEVSSASCEILSGGAFYDYEAKYGPDAFKALVPAVLTEEALNRGRKLALTVYQALHCTGLARVDFFLDPNGKFWLNEINPFPGFTRFSGYPLIWKAGGLELGQLLDRLIYLGLHRHRALQEIRGAL
jgi:UDP-N-acetylmuramate--alanine ligase